MARKIHNLETQAEIPAFYDQPAITPMTADENIESIFTLIKMLFIEYQKLEIFHYSTAMEVDHKFRLKQNLNTLYMSMTQMMSVQSEHSQKGDWIR